MTTNNAGVAAVSLKLPMFWPERAAVWFVQAEAQFRTYGISQDDTKFHYITAALNQDTATRVLDLLQQPPAASKYKVLKQRLLDAFLLMDAQRAARLLHMLGLGDDKPSQLMDRMLILLGDHQSGFLFREIFMQQLPTDIRTILTQAKITDHRELAIAVDVLWAANNPGVQAIHGPCHRSGRTTTDRTSAHTGTSNPETPGVCYFHQCFGDVTRQCRPPCSFTTKGNGQAGLSVATMAAGTIENSLFIQDCLSRCRIS